MCTTNITIDFLFQNPTLASNKLNCHPNHTWARRGGWGYPLDSFRLARVWFGLYVAKKEAFTFGDEKRDPFFTDDMKACEYVC